MLTDLHALAALNADIGLGSGPFRNDLDAGEIGIKFFVKSIRTGPDTLQTSHTLGILFNSELLHNRGFSFSLFYTNIIQSFPRNSNGYFLNKDIFLATKKIMAGISSLIPVTLEIIALKQKLMEVK